MDLHLQDLIMDLHQLDMDLQVRIFFTIIISDADFNGISFS